MAGYPNTEQDDSNRIVWSYMPHNAPTGAATVIVTADGSEYERVNPRELQATNALQLFHQCGNRIVPKGQCGTA